MDMLNIKELIMLLLDYSDLKAVISKNNNHETTLSVETRKFKK